MIPAHRQLCFSDDTFLRNPNDTVAIDKRNIPAGTQFSINHPACVNKLPAVHQNIPAGQKKRSRK
jgi:hypothetical protein